MRTRRVQSTIGLAATLIAGCVGEPVFVEDLEQGVVGGRAESGYPAAGYLATGSEPETLWWHCGATLIAPDVAVTAAHCVLSDGESVPSPQVYGIGFGPVAARRTHVARAVYPAPTYHADILDPTRATQAVQDLAVVLLARPVTDVTPAVIAPAPVGCNYRYVGYGRVTPGSSAVRTGYTGERKSAALCVREQTIQSLRTQGVDGGLCWGDSGGGLHVENSNRVVGVFADFDDHVYDCYVGSFGRFAALADHREFIDCAVSRMRTGDPQLGAPFRDAACHWAEPMLRALRARGVIRGYPDGTFRPAAFITRAEFAVLVAAAFAPPALQPARAFRDVPSSHWAAGAIDTVQRAGFLQGYPDGTFRPNARISKIEVAAALASGLGLRGPETALSGFGDAASFPAWSRASAAGALQNGLLVAYPDPRVFEPMREARRAEVAAMVHQALVHRGALPPIETRYVAAPSR